MKPRLTKGFSLIELMIAVAIIAILAAIAIPSYQNQVKKARRADAKIALTELSQLQETYHADYNRYASTFNKLLRLTGSEKEKYGFTTSGSNVLSKEKYYSVELKLDEDGKYLLTAIPVDKDYDTQCSEFTLDSSGKKDAKVSKQECW